MPKRTYLQEAWSDIESMFVWLCAFLIVATICAGWVTIWLCLGMYFNSPTMALIGVFGLPVLGLILWCWHDDLKRKTR